MNMSWYQTFIIGLFGGAGACATLRWFHPATISLTVFSIVLAASWVLLAVFLLRSKEYV